MVEQSIVLLAVMAGMQILLLFTGVEGVAEVQQIRVMVTELPAALAAAARAAMEMMVVIQLVLVSVATVEMALMIVIFHFQRTEAGKMFLLGHLAKAVQVALVVLGMILALLEVQSKDMVAEVVVTLMAVESLERVAQF